MKKLVLLLVVFFIAMGTNVDAQCNYGKAQKFNHRQSKKSHRYHKHHKKQNNQQKKKGVFKKNT